VRSALLLAGSWIVCGAWLAAAPAPRLAEDRPGALGSLAIPGGADALAAAAGLPVPAQRATIALELIRRLQGASPGDGAIIFNDPLLIQLMGKLGGINLTDASPNPFYMAAWIGLLVTSLNLMPVGQLDGGHGTFAVFGGRAHKIIGRVAFVLVAVTAVLGFIWHGSPSGFLYTVLLGVMLKVRHPAPEEMEPLGRGRTIVALITLIVFALSFVPFPITLT